MIELTKILILIVVFALSAGCTTWSPEQEIYLASIQKSELSRGELTARYFGASTILLSDGSTSILIDGFFSRPAKGTALLTGIKPTPAIINEQLDKHDIKDLDALLVSHAHYDHILDAGYVAKATGATVYGSEKAINLATEQADCLDTKIIKNNSVVKEGLFTIKFYETPHSPKGGLTKFAEWIFLTFSRGLDYKEEGETYSFLVSHPSKDILVVPSAGYIAGILPDVKADTVFLSLGLLGKQDPDIIRNYWNETVKKTGANLVILTHWDRLSGNQLIPTPMPFDNLGKSVRIFKEELEKNEGTGTLIRVTKFSKPFKLDAK